MTTTFNVRTSAPSPLCGYPFSLFKGVMEMRVPTVVQGSVFFCLLRMGLYCEIRCHATYVISDLYLWKHSLCPPY